MEEAKDKQRRKGRPMKRKELPIRQEMINISLTLGVGLIVLFTLYGFLSKARSIIRYSHESAMQTAAAAAVLFSDMEETDAFFKKLAECSAPNARKTEDLSEDEKTVIRAAFAPVEEMPEYKALAQRLKKLHEIYPGIDRIAIGLYDKSSGLLMLGVDEADPPGSVIKPDDWDDPDEVGHLVHKSISAPDGSLSREAVVWFDSKHMYEREYKGLILTTLAAVIFAAACCIAAAVKTDAYTRKQEISKYRFYGAAKADMKPELNLYPGIDNPRDLYDRLMKIWCVETCAPRLRDKWSEDNKTLGQCSITAFLVQDIFGGEVRGIPQEDGSFHCYNVVDGKVFDLTSEQFDEELTYSDTDPVQSREEHFSKAEKKQRYDYLKSRLPG